MSEIRELTDEQHRYLNDELEDLSGTELPEKPAGAGHAHRTDGARPMRDTLLFDELRGMVVDLPVGTILPGWVQKSAVIEGIDRVESEHEEMEGRNRARLDQVGKEHANDHWLATLDARDAEYAEVWAWVTQQLSAKWDPGSTEDFQRGYETVLNNVAAMLGIVVPPPSIVVPRSRPCTFERDGAACDKPESDPVHPGPDDRMRGGRHVYR